MDIVVEKGTEYDIDQLAQLYDDLNDVYENNVPAIKLCEKCGFEYIDTIDLGIGNYGLNHFKLYEKLL